MSRLTKDQLTLQVRRDLAETAFKPTATATDQTRPIHRTMLLAMMVALKGRRSQLHCWSRSKLLG